MIKNIPAGERKSDNSQVTKDKVTSLIKDGLKFREYENAERWKRKNDKPVIVMLRMKTK